MLKIFNTLGRELQEFKPIDQNKIGVYTCGPTVYDYVTIGNWRTYTLGDFVIRTLRYLGYEVEYVMNVTDVGHLTGDNSGDSSIGEDRMEKAERREGKTAWEIAKFYSDSFENSLPIINVTKPDVIAYATKHIEEQIKQIEEIEKKGFSYKINDGIYFDTEAFENAGFKYGELSNLDQIMEGARVEINPEKRNPRDFALWKFSPKDKTRHMEWDSPWGVGFPGWHIECSAMSMKYLGDKFDIHIGGEDLMSTHHPCEMAQAEVITGEPFVNYWIHGAFLLVNGGRMGKSLGNAYTLKDLSDRGYTGIDLRYFYMSGHYRKKINFTWEALEGAKTARIRLVANLKELKKNIGDLNNLVENETYRQQFIEAIEDDFNIPKALAVTWDVIKSDLPAKEKFATVMDFDKVLGLKLDEEVAKSDSEEYSEEVKNLIEQREKAREEKNWQLADEIRNRLKDEFGVEVKDKK